MSLSVCLIASAPAARVAALLEPVRELADEIVIAADSRRDAATLAGYAALATLAILAALLVAHD